MRSKLLLFALLAVTMLGGAACGRGEHNPQDTSGNNGTVQ
jgi:hypothetical protein